MKKYDTYEVPPRGYRIETDDELRSRVMERVKNNHVKNNYFDKCYRMVIPLKENEICVLKTQKEDIILNEEFYNEIDRWDKEVKKYKDSIESKSVF